MAETTGERRCVLFWLCRGIDRELAPTRADFAALRDVMQAAQAAAAASGVPMSKRMAQRAYRLADDQVRAAAGLPPRISRPPVRRIGGARRRVGKAQSAWADAGATVPAFVPANLAPGTQRALFAFLQHTE